MGGAGTRSTNRYDTWSTATAIAPTRPLGARRRGRLPIMPMTPSVFPGSDEAILVAALRGSHRDFSILVARFRRPLLSLARRWAPTLDPALLEDVVQEVWTAIIAQLSHGGLVFDPARERAVDFVATFVPNAAQAVRSRLRSAGERSRPARPTPSDFEALGAEWRWGKVDPSGDADIAAKVAAPDETAAIDARIDLELLAAGAEPKVAQAIAVIIADGATISQAAEVVGLSPSTFSRRLSELGQRAA